MRFGLHCYSHDISVGNSNRKQYFSSELLKWAVISIEIVSCAWNLVHGCQMRLLIFHGAASKRGDEKEQKLEGALA